MISLFFKAHTRKPTGPRSRWIHAPPSKTIYSSSVKPQCLQHASSRTLVVFITILDSPTFRVHTSVLHLVKILQSIVSFALDTSAVGTLLDYPYRGFTILTIRVLKKTIVYCFLNSQS
ncbi:hypothetical protein PGTUg99_010565 [Puccinia graminis f. sp. tritici]|uniref:Uncharacterized protein n=1 Tax=Puccinia graminis f. sp. tritici TaxID=56615 RepID=A0A5B0RYR0_PUCGR|nr:hypothetical protein PGTUg99_010565 [Puccinia graminis f. sp. tritici]